MSQLVCNNVSVGYEGKIIAKNINIEINDGSYLCIVGENGTGKSTFLKTLVNLKAPIEGKINLGDNLKYSEVGYLPQQSEIQRDFPASVMEIVLSGCLNRTGLRPFYNKKEKSYANEIMNKLGIDNLKNKCYSELSGGQQQRVLLARALCSTQKILFLDEPVAGLDPRATQEMYEIISNLNKNEKITIIMVSHDITSCIKYATHILHLSQTPLFFGTKDEYVNSNIGKSYILMGGSI